MDFIGQATKIFFIFISNLFGHFNIFCIFTYRLKMSAFSVSRFFN